MKYTVRVEDNYTTIIKENENGSITIIPSNSENSDYQRYLRWLEDPTAEEGGTLS